MLLTPLSGEESGHGSLFLIVLIVLRGKVYIIFIKLIVKKIKQV